MMHDIALIVPEIFLLTMTCVVLVVDLFLKPSAKGLTYILSQLALIGTFFLCGQSIAGEPQEAFLGQFVLDPFSQYSKLAILGLVFLVFLYGRGYVRVRSMARGEFHTLTLFSTLGMMVLVSAKSTLTVYLGLELMSLPLYALVALNRESSQCVEAGMKYFVTGALASGMLLYGISLLYGLSGSIYVTEIAQQLTQSPVDNTLLWTFALVFVVAGISFKLGLVPFHMWMPDVYQGSPTSITLLIGTASKVAALGMFYRILGQTLPSLYEQWHHMLLWFAFLSLAIGNIVAIAQTDIKRMLAYSTISHVGFMVLGFLTGPFVGYWTAFYYMIVYVLVAACGFGVIILLSHKGFEAQKLEDFKGLADRSPWIAFIMLIVMFSFAGVPPTVGFYAKLIVLEALVKSDMVFFAVFALVFSIIGAFYYLRVVKLMYFDKAVVPNPVSEGGDFKLVLSLNGFALLAFGLFPAPLVNLCQRVFIS